jgi:hypothetical protein
MLLPILPADGVVSCSGHVLVERSAVQHILSTEIDSSFYQIVKAMQWEEINMSIDTKITAEEGNFCDIRSQV